MTGVAAQGLDTRGYLKLVWRWPTAVAWALGMGLSLPWLPYALWPP